MPEPLLGIGEGLGTGAVDGAVVAATVLAVRAGEHSACVGGGSGASEGPAAGALQHLDPVILWGPAPMGQSPRDQCHQKTLHPMAPRDLLLGTQLFGAPGLSCVPSYGGLPAADSCSPVVVYICRVSMALSMMRRRGSFL